MEQITESTSVVEVLRRCPSARRIFDRHGLKGCGGEHGPAESLGFFASVHQVDLAPLLEELNRELESPAPEPYVYRETLADTIYQRFFKAGIAIALTVGAAWGAVNLLQIALGKNLLQPALIPSIHAHAHAMIFGWLGLFVMGFAYQSFPRFKYTTLWRPDLANLTFYLMVGGIGTRMAAEMLAPSSWALLLGAVSAASEFAAISLFVVIIFKTARHSTEPSHPYERFIFGAFAWFWVQSVFSDVFFFAKATAGGPDDLIRRIALLDPPLRDVQLLGFAAMIIAGVSQRFVPVVYGLGKPAEDRQKLIFALMNGSLLLDVVSYLALLLTGRPYFALGLELAYLLMAAWAILLVVQLRVFSPAKEVDRSLKFIRAAYVWLLGAMAMMPLFMAYGRWTGQVFPHAYWGAHRHAFTVGFVSLMIVGVSSRVVPILAGVDSKRLTALWGPFILLNLGCGGRVVLQILIDFVPKVAYPLVGFTGFLELVALAWWGFGLWRVMNLAKTHRAAILRAPAPSPAR